MGKPHCNHGGLKMPDLIRLQKEIETAKHDRAIKGDRLKQLLKDLEDEADCATLAEAKKELETIQKTWAQLITKLNAGYEKLEENFQW